MAAIELTINGKARSVDADPNTPLLWVLRDSLHLTGTKYACGIGLCGSCTVLVEGEPERSCVTTIGDVASKSVTTIEGLSKHGDHPLQKAWLEESVSQCGYCQPGQLMTAAALLAATPKPSKAQIASAMSGVLCRCGTYERIGLAIERAAKEG